MSSPWATIAACGSIIAACGSIIAAWDTTIGECGSIIAAWDTTIGVMECHQRACGAGRGQAIAPPIHDHTPEDVLDAQRWSLI